MKKTLLVLPLVVFAGCGGQQAPAQTAAQAGSQRQTAQSAALPAALRQAMTPGEPAPVLAERGALPTGIVTGRVVETMNAGGYTYLNLATSAGERWSAVREAKVARGSTVSVATQMVAQKFESKTLGRTFDQIIFGTLVDGASAPAMGMSMASAEQHMQPVDTSDVKVDKAGNGNTVAEVWARKSGLQDKTVVVRGKVVKFLPDIMGKNWLHLRDGSGTRMQGNDDIAVTSPDSAKIGDVVTVSGILHVDKDFGSGYRYPVIIEDAKLRRD